MKSGVQIVREQTHDMGQYTSMSGQLGLTGHLCTVLESPARSCPPGTERHPREWKSSVWLRLLPVETGAEESGRSCYYRPWWARGAGYHIFLSRVWKRYGVHSAGASAYTSGPRIRVIENRTRFRERPNSQGPSELL